MKPVNSIHERKRKQKKTECKNYCKGAENIFHRKFTELAYTFGIPQQSFFQQN